MSHQRFPTDGLFGEDELTVTPPPPMISLTASRLATPARSPTARVGSPRITSCASVGVTRLPGC